MTPSKTQPWYRALNRTQWNTLLASNLGWVFDGFEAYSLILTVAVALAQLLPAAQHSKIPATAGAIISPWPTNPEHCRKPLSPGVSPRIGELSGVTS